MSDSVVCINRQQLNTQLQFILLDHAILYITEIRFGIHRHQRSTLKLMLSGISKVNKYV